MSIQRYNQVQGTIAEPFRDGYWVQYADHEREVAALRSALERLVKAEDATNAEYGCPQDDRFPIFYELTQAIAQAKAAINGGKETT